MTLYEIIGHCVIFPATKHLEGCAIEGLIRKYVGTEHKLTLNDLRDFWEFLFVIEWDLVSQDYTKDDIYRCMDEDWYWFEDATGNISYYDQLMIGDDFNEWEEACRVQEAEEKRREEEYKRYAAEVNS